MEDGDDWLKETFDEASEEVEPLVAIPPKTSFSNQCFHDIDENEGDASAAMRVIDEMLQAGGLSDASSVDLRFKVRKIEDALLSSRENRARVTQSLNGSQSSLEELKLLESSCHQSFDQVAASDLRRLNLEWTRWEMLPSGSSTWSRLAGDAFPRVARQTFNAAATTAASAGNDVERLRMQLLYAQNELLQYRTINEGLSFELEGLASAKFAVDAQVETSIKPEVEWNSKLKQLADEIDETKFEIAETHKECRILKEELEENERRNELLENAVEKKREERRKEGEIMDDWDRKKDAILKEIEAKEKEKQVWLQTPEMEEKEKESKKKEEEMKQLEIRETQIRAELNLHKTLTHEFEAEREKLDRLVTTRNQELRDLTQSNEELTAQNNRLGEMANAEAEKIQAEKGQLAGLQRQLEKMERNRDKAILMCKKAKDGEEQARLIRDQLQLDYERELQRPRAISEERQRRSEEKESALKNLRHEERNALEEQVNVEVRKLQELAMVKQQETFRAELVELSRVAAVLAEVREEKSRYVVKVQNRLKREKENLKVKIQSVSDHGKKNAALQAKLEKFTPVYEQEKKLRNDTVNRIQECNQMAVELKEKTRHHENEFENLDFLFKKLDQQLQKRVKRNTDGKMLKNALQRDQEKFNAALQSFQSIRCAQEVDSKRLLTVIDDGEEKMMAMKSGFEEQKQTKDRREATLKKTEREFQRCSAQSETLEAKLERQMEEESLQGEELRFLELEKENLLRDVQLRRKVVPEKLALEREILLLNAKVDIARSRRGALERIATNDNTDSHNNDDDDNDDVIHGRKIRFVGGTVEPENTEEKAKKKISELEKKLSEKKETLKGKELLLSQSGGDFTEHMERREEIRLLELEKESLLSDVQLRRKILPERLALKRESLPSNAKMDIIRGLRGATERNADDDDDDNDDSIRGSETRFVGGVVKPENEEEIAKRKILDLEKKLAKKEDALMEKDLLLTQVSRLTDRVERKLAADWDENLETSKSINQLQRNIDSSTRKMMSLVAELSMRQGQASQLQEEVERQETLLRSCHENLERGQPPSEEIHRDWLKEVKKMETLRIAEDASSDGDDFSGVRPNAYIPDVGDGLPLPVPYGSQAPFKPREAANHLKHYRKPKHKSIEL